MQVICHTPKRRNATRCRALGSVRPIPLRFHNKSPCLPPGELKPSTFPASDSLSVPLAGICNERFVKPLDVSIFGPEWAGPLETSGVRVYVYKYSTGQDVMQVAVSNLGMVSI